jgi:2-iminobutanoate/2-iminopropanoate deaminase
MPSQRKAINSDKVSKHEAKSSHVIRAAGLLHVSGWMGDVPETGKIVEGGIEAQTVCIPTLATLRFYTYPDFQNPSCGKLLANQSTKDQAMKNIAACLEAAGSSMDKVVNRRLYIISTDHLPAIQKVTTRYFEEPYPCSTAVQVGRLYARRRQLYELD